MYHGALDAAAATWLTLLAIVAFYTAAVLQRPGLLQLVTAQLALGGTAVLGVRWRGVPLASLGLIAPHRHALIGAVLVGISAWYPNLCLALWVQHALGGATRVAGLERLVEAPHLGLTLACISIFPALCEELAFRGLWARALAARHGLALAVAVTAPVFGAYHLSSAQLLPATLLGAVLAWASLRAGSVWISIAIHAANNATAILAARGHLGLIGIAMNEHPHLALAAALAVTTFGLALLASSPPLLLPSTSPSEPPSPPPS